jgi:hypothetical protein
MGFWDKRRLIFTFIRDHTPVSIRHVARHTGLSKSSVCRLVPSMARRHQHPDSVFWETEEGYQWLLRLVVAVLYHFGLRRGVGAETMRTFCADVCLEQSIGGSPRTLRTGMAALEALILETPEAWEREGLAQGHMGPIVGSVDATFWEQMLLVFMDLRSGYVLHAEVAEDRSYETWFERVKTRLEPMKTPVLSLGSARAKALSTLAETALECPSLPELFHVLHDLVKGSSLAISRQLQAARQGLIQAQPPLDKCEASGACEAEGEGAQVALAACQTERERWQPVRRTSRGHLGAMSLWVHPCGVVNSTPHSAHEVEAQLQAEVEALHTFLATHGLPVHKTVLDKVRRQLAGLAAVMDVWWELVRQDGKSQMALTPGWEHWVEAYVLPLMYGEQQVSRTRPPGRRAPLVETLQAVQVAFEAHPLTSKLTPEVLAGWKTWAAEHAQTFQRASAAVEGRKGSLAQMHHNHRGLPKRRYRVWSALPNFDCRASNGSTPASRFFQREFPCLFEAVGSQMDGLPRPRKRQPVGAN